jgi:hypothetical protein
VKWEFEREGYQLPSGWYVPDFWLPDWGWVEIKGQAPTGQEQCLALELCSDTQKPVVIFPGSPLDMDEWECLVEPCPVVAVPDTSISSPSAVWTGLPWLPRICPGCRQMVIEEAGRSGMAHLDVWRDADLVVHSGWTCSPGVPYRGEPWNGQAPEILRAISTVRSHRFWDPQKAA